MVGARPLGGAAAPAYLLRDTFTGNADGTNLNGKLLVETPAKSWTVDLGSFDVQSGRAHVTSLTGFFAVSSADAGAANVSNTVTVRTDGTVQNELGPIIRMTDSNNYWVALFSNDGTDRIDLIERNAGTGTVRATVNLTFSPNTDYVVNLTANGTSLTASVDGVPLLSYSSSFNQSATRCGVQYDYTGTGTHTFDNFEVVAS